MGLRDFLPEKFLLGTGAGMCPLKPNLSFQNLISENFNSITLANNFKRKFVCTELHSCNWEPIDWMVDFCQKHDIVLRGHGLLVRGDKSYYLESLEDAAIESHFKNYVYQGLTRYRGLIPFYDVAIELVNEDGRLIDDFWKKHLGVNFAHKVFQWTHEADPDALLFYSDYGLHEDIKQSAVFRLINSIRDAGIPVHGLAIQIHHNLTGAYKLLWLKRLIRACKRENLIPHVSEITLWANPRIPYDAAEIVQSFVYEKVLELCLAEGVEFMGVWSCCDRFVWRHPEKRPGWWDEDYQPKEAARKIERSLRNFGKNIAEKSPAANPLEFSSQ
jgi:endo-1,4-beta-xylanase